MRHTKVRSHAWCMAEHAMRSVPQSTCQEPSMTLCMIQAAPPIRAPPHDQSALHSSQRPIQSNGRSQPPHTIAMRHANQEHAGCAARMGPARSCHGICRCSESGLCTGHFAARLTRAAPVLVLCQGHTSLYNSCLCKCI